MCLVVDQKLRGLEAFGYNWLYIEAMYWLPITTLCIFTFNFWHPMPISRSLRCVSTERQQFLVIHFGKTKGCKVTSFHSDCIGCFYRWRWNLPACCPILAMSINNASTIVGLVSLIHKQRLCRCVAWSKYWPALKPKMLRTTSLLSPKNKYQRSINDFGHFIVESSNCCTTSLSYNPIVGPVHG